MKLDDTTTLEVQNIVINIDGTISRLPYSMMSSKKGWWYTDGVIYWQKK